MPDGYTDVGSPRMAQACGLTLIDRFVRVVKQAGAPSEDATERDGFLSHAAETHSAGAGIGFGFMIASTGEWRYLGVLLELILLGNRGDTRLAATLIRDILTELPYFLGGLVLGAALGAWARLVSGVIAGA